MKIGIVYHFFAHYRGPIIQELFNSSEHDFYFIGGEHTSSSYSTLKLYEFKDSERFVKVSNFWFFKYFLWQSRLLEVLYKSDYDAVIFLGDWKFFSTWLSLLILKMKNIPSLFWSHGIRFRKTSLNSKLKFFFLKQFSHGGFVYDDLAKEILEKMGFSTPVSVIYNSLDYNHQINILQVIKSKSNTLFNVPYVVFSGRLETRKKLKELIKAIALLNSRDVVVGAIIIGDGPDKKVLLNLVKELDVINKFKFVGSCYDENILCNYFFHSSACVIPGSTGLTAIHALTYGTPVITNDDFEHHGPEIASVIEGISGFYFKKDDHYSLACTIQKLISMSPDNREILKANCQQIVSNNFTPKKQHSVINNHLKFLFDDK